MTVKIAADMAYPVPDKVLPANVEAVLGYVGQVGIAANVWTPAEAATARKARGHWWPIWNASTVPMSAADGQRAGSEMVSKLPAYGVGKDEPVFLDVEHNTWNADPEGAMAGIRAWKQEMNRAGYSRAYAYVPRSAGFDWIADWSNEEPTELPLGVIGIQYGGNVKGGAYDLSGFDACLWDTPHVAQHSAEGKDEVDMASLDDIRAIVREEVGRATTILYRGDVDPKTHVPVPDGFDTHNCSLTDLGPIIRDIAAKLGADPAGQ